MRHRELSLWVLALGLTPLHHAFVLAPAGRGLSCNTCKVKRGYNGRMEVSARRLPGQRARRKGLAVPMTSSEDVEEGAGKEEVRTDRSKDGGVLAATGVSGALVGYCLARTLNLDLDLLGAVTGCVAAVGLLAQEGPVGKAALTVGEFTLAAFDVARVVASSSDVPGKVVGTVGEEILEVVELTSSAVTKGYIESLPEPDFALKNDFQASQKQVGELKQQLDQVTGALSDAQEQLRERAESKRVVESAKATEAQLAEAKSVMAEKDAEIAESLRLARREKDTFDRELTAAKDETSRFRGMVESRDDLDENFKALSEASDTLEARVQEYEERLRSLTSENDSIRADYSAEVESMKTERGSMRERISDLESSLSGAETRLSEERAALEEELTSLADALKERSSEAEMASRRTEEIQATLDKATAEKTAVVEAARKVSQEAKDATAAAEKAMAEQAALLAEKAALARQSAEAEERAAAAEKAAAAANVEMAEKARAAALEAEAAERAAEAAEALAAEEARAARMAMEAQEERDARERARAAEEAEAAQAVAEARAAEAEAMAIEEGRAMYEMEDAGLPPVAAAMQEIDPGMEAENAKEQAEHREAEMKANQKRIEKAKPKPPNVDEEITSQEGFMKLTVKDLRERCKLLGLATSGKKADLVDRLLSTLVSA